MRKKHPYQRGYKKSSNSTTSIKIAGLVVMMDDLAETGYGIGNGKQGVYIDKMPPLPPGLLVTRRF